MGCLLIGLAFGLTGKLNLVNHSARLFFITGFLGALTTFSSYAFETVTAANTGSYVVVLANILANNVFGLALVLLGMWVVRFII
jgi:fluoride exporter